MLNHITCVQMDNYLFIYVFLHSQRIYFSPCYKECSFPHMICLEKIPNSVSCTRCTRSLHSVSINFLCFSYIFLEIYGRSMLCACVILGYNFSSLLYVLPIWIVAKDGISQCIPLCPTTRDHMMPICFFLKPLLFTKFLLFFHCNNL